ncbi:MAG: sigma 54-interacting transcriptional regulator [Acidobacteria bacterium]|nr:sigma 54-interacting transcriptional regulator [Acidobacteriota bacterium]
MSRVPVVASGLRVGRLLETSEGLFDLATGWRVRLVTTIVPHDAVQAWRPSQRVGGRRIPPSDVCLDSWLTRDVMGRWVARAAIATGPVPPAAPSGRHEAPIARPADWTTHRIGVTTIYDVEDWYRLACMAMRAGLTPVVLPMLVVLQHTPGAAHPARCPPVFVAVPADDACRARDVLIAWTVAGGRVAAIARQSPSSASWPAASLHARTPCPPPRRVLHHAAHARLVGRAWRASSEAPACPAFSWVAAPAGDRALMTHLELLDVSAQVDDARRDEDALSIACRAVRRHTRARAAGILVRTGGAVRAVARDGDTAAVEAWSRLAVLDGVDSLVAADGWFAVGRHESSDGTTVHVGGTWASREAGLDHQPLLTVFARLVAPRVCALPPPPRAAAPGLEQTLVGSSATMQDVRAQIALAARAPFPVLIRGESGCGKELAARAIHGLGPRRHRRCAAINCAALPDELIESELFGHVRGAFTGAAADRVGLFDDADGGTLFLDEVGELGARAQAKLLRVLQDGEVRRVGENQSRRVDVRVIAATNVSLEDAVRRGTFRADLFYRLDVVRVRMPALRERREDIPELARHLWHDCTARVGSRARLEARVLDALSRQDWPGNVRQLQNTLAALAVRVPPRGRVTVDDLPPDARRTETTNYLCRSGLEAARREFEATYVREALTRAGGRPSLAARDLGLTRQGLSKLVRRLGLDEEDADSRLP